ncbi:hypothetical protein AB834_03695 [PVC group bacterium (ex Bugula neritina AB1)]|nr:hypothetical protein AB834_03695 [PVC group bacterium (ex Bugula neritina AB1)]
MPKPFYNAQPLSCEGFKNCVRYASIKFDSSFSIFSKFSENNFMDTVIKDFILKLKAYDLNLFSKKSNGQYLMREFLTFRDSVISGKAPILRLKFVDPRLVILAIVSFDDELMTYCNIVEDPAKNYVNFSIKNYFFSRLKFKDKVFYFEAVRFIVLSTVGGINTYQQVRIITEAYTKVAQNDNDSNAFETGTISDLVGIIRDKFFGHTGTSSLYKSDLLLEGLFKHSEIKSFHEISVGNVSRFFKCYKFDPLIGSSILTSKEISFEPLTFFEVPADCSSINRSSEFFLLKVYCEFLTMKFHEYIFNQVEADGTFIFFVEDGISSCLVDANNAFTLSSYFDLSLGDIHKLNARAMYTRNFYNFATLKEYSTIYAFIRKESSLNKNLLMQNSIIDFSCLFLKNFLS